MFNQINLDTLMTFQAVAKRQSMKAAAKALGVTPSAVSQAISKLESQIGVQLFLREHKKITLAQGGMELKLRIDPLLQRITSEISDFCSKSVSAEPTGTLAIGAPAEFGSYFLIKWFSEFQRDHKKTKIRLRLGSPRTLLGYLHSGEVDFLIADDGPYYEDIQHSHAIQPLFREELVLCYSSSMGKIDPSYKSIMDLPHLDYSNDGSAVGIWYLHHFGKKPKQLDIVMTAENARAVIRGVTSGLGLGMVPKYLIQKELDAGSIKLISPSSKPCMNDLMLIQHKDRVPPLAERLFVAALRARPKVLGKKN